MNERLDPSKLSPWIAIWIRPRSTIRQIVARGPTRATYFLAAVGGVNWVWTLGLPWFRQLGLNQATTLLLISTVGAFLGIGLMHMNGFVLRGTGRWLGGRASAGEVRTAYAWPFVSAIPILAIAVATDLILYPASPNGVSLSTDPGLRWLVNVSPIAKISLGLWGSVLWWLCLAEVHQFSVWRSLGALGIGGLLLGVTAGCGLLALVPCASGVWFVLAVLGSGSVNRPAPSSEEGGHLSALDTGFGQ